MSARTLPGFRPALSFTLLYLSFMVLIPLAGLFLKTAQLTWAQYWHIVSGPRAVASYALTLGTSATAAGVNAVFGLLVAWVLVRYRFPGRRARCDRRFAAGAADGGRHRADGALRRQRLAGRAARARGLKVAFTPLRVRSRSFSSACRSSSAPGAACPDLEPEVEEAAASLGATRAQTFWKVIFPAILPRSSPGPRSPSPGARRAGRSCSSRQPAAQDRGHDAADHDEAGADDYRGATALATVMLGLSFVLAATISMTQAWLRGNGGEGLDEGAPVAARPHRPRAGVSCPVPRDAAGRGVRGPRQGFEVTGRRSPNPRRGVPWLTAVWRGFGAAEHDVRHRGGVGHRALPVSRAGCSSLDRLAVCRVAGDFRPHLRAALRRPGRTPVRGSRAHDITIIFAIPASCSRRCSSRSHSWRELIPVMGSRAPTREATSPRRQRRPAVLRVTLPQISWA